jgi:hypothetical protein
MKPSPKPSQPPKPTLRDYASRTDVSHLGVAPGYLRDFLHLGGPPYGFRVVSDAAVPAAEAHLFDHEGRVLLRLTT